MDDVSRHVPIREFFVFELLGIIERRKQIESDTAMPDAFAGGFLGNEDSLDATMGDFISPSDVVLIFIEDIGAFFPEFGLLGASLGEICLRGLLEHLETSICACNAAIGFKCRCVVSSFLIC